MTHGMSLLLRNLSPEMSGEEGGGEGVFGIGILLSRGCSHGARNNQEVLVLVGEGETHVGVGHVFRSWLSVCLSANRRVKRVGVSILINVRLYIYIFLYAHAAFQHLFTGPLVQS